jgi:hypothetical protein
VSWVDEVRRLREENESNRKAAQNAYDAGLAVANRFRAKRTGIAALPERMRNHGENSNFAGVARAYAWCADELKAALRDNSAQPKD